MCHFCGVVGSFVLLGLAAPRERDREIYDRETPLRRRVLLCFLDALWADLGVDGIISDFPERFSQLDD